MRLGFRCKTILGIAAIETVLVMVLLLSHQSHLRETLGDELAQRARSSHQLLASAALDAVLGEDLATLHELVETAQRQAGMGYVRIYGIGGNLLASGGDEQVLAQAFVADAGGRGDEHDDGYLDVAGQIQIGGEHVGRVEFGLSTTHLDRALAEALRHGMVIGSAGILVSLGFSLLLGTYLTRQLGQLNEGAKRLSSGDHDHRVPVYGRDELADLALTFNHMSEQLAREHRRLRDSNEAMLHESGERLRAERELRHHRDQLQAMVEAQTLHLRNALEEAEHANAAKSEFLSNMSHELRTPMHAVLSFARLGVQRLETAPRAKLGSYYEHIVESAERLLKLINGLLSLSQLEAGRVEFEMCEQDVGALLARAREQLSPLARERGLVVNLTLPERRLMAEGDAERLLQILINLLGNAIKFSPDGGRIELSGKAIKQSDEVMLQVSDQGPGLPVDELESVFEKFTQSSLTKTGAGGSGLGLAISREIAAAHGGRIEVRNRAEGGACFCLRIPRRQALSSSPA